MNRMIPVALAGLALCTSAVAADNVRKAQDIGIGSGIVLGAVAAGPFGAIVGAALGGHYADSVARARQLPALQDDLQQSRSALGESEQRIVRLNRSLFETRGELRQLGEEMSELLLQRAVYEGLQMDLMYPTGASELTPSAAASVERLARLLQKLPEMTVRLDGYADPRGTDGYNLQLSRDRAEAVRAALVAAGVSIDRISIHAHGESVSQSAEGDLDGFALERRVRIRLFGADDGARVARQD